MNETISTTLRERAEGDVHIEWLLDAVHAGARRQRRRRIALSCAAVAAVVAAGVVTVATNGSDGPPDGPADQPPTVLAPPPVPPRVTGFASAVDSPAAFGSDATLFHLDLADLSGWRHIAWAAQVGHEELIASTPDGDELYLEASRDPAQLAPMPGPTSAITVNGLPAETGRLSERTGPRPDRHAIRWQPLPGIWAQVQATGAIDVALHAARGLRLDGVRRCAVPFRLPQVTAQLVKCNTYATVDQRTGAWMAAGGVWFRLGPPGTVEYQVAVGGDEQPVTPNATVKGREVEVVRGGIAALEFRYRYGSRTAYFWAHGVPDENAMRSMVAAFTPVEDPDPRAWPANPFGSAGRGG